MGCSGSVAAAPPPADIEPDDVEAAAQQSEEPAAPESDPVLVQLDEAKQEAQNARIAAEELHMKEEAVKKMDDGPAKEAFTLQLQNEATVVQARLSK